MEAKEALKLLEKAKDGWSEAYREAKSDLRFSIGLDQWGEKDRAARGDRPCLVINQLPQFIHQVMNDERMNTPSINVIPANDGADIETAKIYKGLIRQIEYKSKADEAYDTAGEYAIRCGIGFIRLEHDYISEDSFLQELQIKSVKNPLSVFIDPNSVESDGCDAEWAIVLDDISKSDFERTYPGREFVSFEDAENGKIDESAETIKIAELYKKEYSEVTGVMNEKGGFEEVQKVEEGQKSKKLRKVVIKRYKFNGEDKVLEETTFPGKYIPIVPVYGEEIWVDGKRKILSLIRQSKDAQRRLNHWASKESELLDLAPISPYTAPLGGVDGLPEWEAPDNAKVLRYHHEDEEGNPLPPPNRIAPPPVPAGIINAMMGAKENIKETMGMYNASIGQRSNETSGVAINARKVEGEVATYHFADNRNRSIAQVGRVLVSAIPEIYDSSRIIQIIGDEEESEMVAINGATYEGQEDIYNLKDSGAYDVRVVTGASYTTKRQEAATFMESMVKANPALINVIGDLLVKNLDIAGADAVSSRLKKTIPPQLLEGEEDEEGNIIDPEKEQMKQMIAEMQAKMQAMAMELQSKNREYEIKEQGNLIKDRQNQQDFELGKMKILNEVQTDSRKQRLDEAKFVEDRRDKEISEIKEMLMALNNAFLQQNAVGQADINENF